jgi:two-component sensor histidine kinase
VRYKLKQTSSAESVDFLSGGGAMADLVCSADWLATPLGPIDGWPQSLRTAVSLGLASPFPVSIIWGPDHRQIYNDAYRAVCGDAHPAALGQAYPRTWRSVWPEIGHAFERALGGESVFVENQRLFLLRNGFLEEAFFTVSFSPIRDETGGIGGLFHTVTETTTRMIAERRATRFGEAGARMFADNLGGEQDLDPAIAPEPETLALLQTEQQLAFALEAGRMGTWELDIASGRLTASEACRTLFGFGPNDPFDRFDYILARVHPDDRQRRGEAVAEAVATGVDIETEYRIIKPGGEICWILSRGRATYDDGNPVRIAGVAFDITVRRTAEDHQRLLIAELNHRVKNTLSTVQSIAMQTHQSDDTFLPRIQALARAHDLLTEASWEGASLADVVNRTLALHVAGAPERMLVSGPAIRLSPNAAVTLNLAFHELATNAVKYGSLSNATGRVTVAWTIDDRSSPTVVDIEWLESGGPAVAMPTRRGFGSRLIERGLAHELGGECRLSFQPRGLECHFRVPFSAKLQPAP